MEAQDAAAARRVSEAAERLLEKLEQAVRELDAVTVMHREKVKTESGEQVTEYTEKLPRKKGLIDRGGLKQLTGVLKDLSDILYRDPELDNREREARIQRLEQELSREPDSDGVTVILAGEAEQYAG